ncbi:MAG: hypothetical protein WC761_02290 [Candidatus Paceibacterota bacterium]
MPDQEVPNWSSVNRTVRWIDKDITIMFVRRPTDHEISLGGCDHIGICLYEERLVYCVLSLFDVVRIPEEIWAKDPWSYGP